MNKSAVAKNNIFSFISAQEAVINCFL